MRLLLAVLFCSVMLPSAYAEKLPAPTGKPVLTISGKIGNTNVGDKAVFDLAMLEKLGMKLSVIARGISIGDELEYTDEVTLGRSIVNRTPFSGTA